MPKDTEINIKKLAANDKIFMCVFSGRELSEIKNHLKFPNVTYAGNHGLEVEYPSGKKFKIEMPEELLEKHNKLVAELKEKVSENFWTYKNPSMWIFFAKCDKSLNIPFWESIIRSNEFIFKVSQVAFWIIRGFGTMLVRFD